MVFPTLLTLRIHTLGNTDSASAHWWHTCSIRPKEFMVIVIKITVHPTWEMCIVQQCICMYRLGECPAAYRRLHVPHTEQPSSTTVWFDRFNDGWFTWRQQTCSHNWKTSRRCLHLSESPPPPSMGGSAKSSVRIWEHHLQAAPITDALCLKHSNQICSM